MENTLICFYCCVSNDVLFLCRETDNYWVEPGNNMFIPSRNNCLIIQTSKSATFQRSKFGKWGGGGGVLLYLSPAVVLLQNLEVRELFPAFQIETWGKCWKIQALVAYPHKQKMQGKHQIRNQRINCPVCILILWFCQLLSPICILILLILLIVCLPLRLCYVFAIFLLFIFFSAVSDHCLDYQFSLKRTCHIERAVQPSSSMF